MKTLTATLEAAQKADGARQQPAVGVLVTAEPCEWPYLDEPAAYADDGAADCQHASCVTTSGAAMRVRVSAGQYQRMRWATPDTATAANWQTWTNMGAVSGTLCAICADDASATVWLFYTLLGTNRQIYSRKSTDDGVTFAAAVAVNIYVAGTIRAISACATAGVCYFFASRDPGGADPDDKLDAYHSAGAGWVADGAEGGTRYNCTFISACVQQLTSGAWYVGVYACDGADATTRRISMLDYVISTNAWGGGTVLWEAVTASAYDYEGISVLPKTTAFPRYLYCWIERETAVPWRRIKVSVSPSRNFVTEVMTYDYLSSGGGYGARLAHGTTKAFFIGPHWVRRATLYSAAAGQSLDLSANTVRVDVDDVAHRSATSEVWLDNRGAAYAAAGSGSLLALRVGSRVRIALGHTTSAGAETVYQPPRWIKALSFVEATDVGSFLVLHLIDGWGYLDAWQTRRVEEHAGRTLSGVLTRGLCRVTGRYETALHANLARVIARFTSPARQPWATWCRRAIALAGVGIRIRTDPDDADGHGWDSIEAEALTLGGAASAYTYGPAATEHPTRRTEDGPHLQNVGLAEAFGTAVYGEAWDTASAYLEGHEQSAHISDTQTTVAADATALAGYALAQAQRLAWRTELEATPNVGLELYDLITVKDRGGNVNGLRQVTRIRTIYDRRIGRKTEWRQIVGANKA